MFSALAMLNYECDSLTGLCAGGFYGNPGGGYSFRVVNVPYFTEYQPKEASQEVQPIVSDAEQSGQPVSYSELLTGVKPAQSTQAIQALSQPAQSSGIPIEWLLLGGGVLALIAIAR